MSLNPGSRSAAATERLSDGDDRVGQRAAGFVAAGREDEDAADRRPACVRMPGPPRSPCDDGKSVSALSGRAYSGSQIAKHVSPAPRSQRRRPCDAERGNAWWLWCHASPSEGSASQATLVDFSSVSKRRVPRKWHTELTLQVMWWTRKIRTRPPHRSPVAAPAMVPVSAQPASAGVARLSSTNT